MKYWTLHWRDEKKVTHTEKFMTEQEANDFIAKLDPSFKTNLKMHQGVKNGAESIWLSEKGTIVIINTTCVVVSRDLIKRFAIEDLGLKEDST